jgi:hypothetical protein
MPGTSDIIMDIGDIRSRVVGLEHKMSEHTQRLSALEQWRQQSEILDARKDEQLKGMEARIDARFASVEKMISDTNATMRKTIDSIGSNVSWLVKLVIGGIIGGMLIGAGMLVLKGIGI